MAIAFTREVPGAIIHCELTHLARSPIDVGRAREQHARYEGVLRDLGFDVRRVAPAPDLPDAVFVEDVAVVLDEVAVLTRPGAASRRDEVPGVAAALAPLRPLRRIEAPATLDGGDVLVLDREVVVGRSARSSAEGARQLADIVAPFGYRVRAVPVTECLHLKSAVTRVGPRTLLINPAWVSPAAFPGWECITVDRAEPFAANALLAGEAVVYPAEHPRTAARLAAAGIAVRTVPAGELAKAEGGVTCCSLLVRQAAGGGAQRAGQGP